MYFKIIILQELHFRNFLLIFAFIWIYSFEKKRVKAARQQAKFGGNF